MKKVPYIGQVQESECGLCCVAMVMAYYGNKQLVKDLGKIVEIGRDGVSFNDLRNIVNHFKFDAEFYEVSLSRISEINSGPLVVYWNNNHYIVLEKVKNNIFHIIDPNIGRMKLSKEEFEKGFCNLVMLINETENSIKNKKNMNPWKIYSDYFKNNLLSLFLVLIISSLSYVVILIIPNMIQKIIDGLQTDSLNLNSSNIYMLLFGLIPIVLLINFLKNRSIIQLSSRMDKAIYCKLIDKIFQVQYKFFLTRSSSDILYRINLVKANREYFLETVIRGIINLGMLLFIAGVLLFINIKVFFCIMLITIMMLTVLLIIKKFILIKNKEEILEGTKLQGLEYESLASMFTLKATSQEEYIKELIYDQYTKSLNKFKERNFINSYYSTLIQGFSYFGPFILFLLSINLYENNIISLGTTMLCYTISGFYFGSISDVFMSINVFGTVRNNLERIQDILEQENMKDTHNTKVNDLKEIDSIEFNQVSFNYPGQKSEVLKEINLNIKKGSKTAIVGKTGSGKSTIIGLLLGLFDAKSGEIIINGNNIININPNKLKEKIGFVPQEPFVFNKSIKENIKMNRNISDEKIIEAAKIANIHDEIMNMPMKYETVISESGHNISGGQKQRIIIARAIALNPSLIILDEATSSIDNSTEAAISDYFKNNKSTQIIIAHRLSTIVNADNIIVMDNGKIVGQGKHEELLNNNKIYSELYLREEVV